MAAPSPAGWYPDPGGTGQRYFDGTAWTGHRSVTLNDRQRSDLLDRAIISSHCRVLNRGASAASVVTGTPVNHVLHALLTLFLCGLWLPVWIIFVANGGEKHFTIAVTEGGMVQWMNGAGHVISSAQGA